MRLIRTVRGILAFFAVLFVPAGRLDLVEGWAFLVAFLTGVLLISVWGLLRAPELMEERRKTAGDSMGLAVAFVLAWWSLASNPFASRLVRIQEERGHRVATSGPYRYVRHPM